VFRVTYYVLCENMINFLHTYVPSRILISFGPIDVYWYGVFIVLSILAGIGVAIKLAEYHKINKDNIVDLIFYLIVGGIIGARLYHILLEFSYYRDNPLDMFKIWQGGLAIHGALIAGILILWLYVRQHKLNFWQLGSIIVTGLALAQAIGRWGNYFNQELFGFPTNLPWGIPIEPINRITEFYNAQYFHPTFLYESFGSLGIFIILIILHFFYLKGRIKNLKIILVSYLLLYSLLRFIMEYIRIDTTPILFGWRLPQLLSLAVFLITTVYLFIVLKTSRQPLNNI
jgi:phosphatidylglycerol:prolipoprotein diacylglycerol transferase